MNQEDLSPSRRAGESDQVAARLEKLSKLREKRGNAYPNGIKPSDTAGAIHSAHLSKTKEELEASAVSGSVAGRVMAIRDFGKAAFLRIQDRTGILQIFIDRSALTPEEYEEYTLLDLGDLAFAKGKLFRTRTGELSLHADGFRILTKALRPLPEKFHGISDVELRYRSRYLDLLMTEKSRETFLRRSKIVETIRRYFVEQGFVEVETPMMHSVAGGAAARPFKTHHNALDMPLVLRIAPELFLKKLVVGGMDRVFEINRNFRNEGISTQHNPEFTMLEFYQAYATYEDLMDHTEALFQRLGREVIGSETLAYQGKEIHLGGKWKRISVEESILEKGRFKDRSKLRDRASLVAYGKEHGIHMDPKSPTGALLMSVFEAEVEPTLEQPTFITEYPLDVSPLARKNDRDSFITDRFELFITGREMGNGFSELNDPDDQYQRFLAQVRAKNAGDEEACDMDEEYVRALEYGLPPTAGEGIGIDRLVMLFTDSPSIRDVILFPQLRKAEPL